MNDDGMETRRLHLLLELSRLGSMRAVADELGVTTSTVSQQIAALATEVGTALVEPVGRRVRLTPAGRRLAEHAVTILAAVDAARLDLDPNAEPAGILRTAGFATAIRRSLLPAVAHLATTHPQCSSRSPSTSRSRPSTFSPRRGRSRADLRLHTGPASFDRTVRRHRCGPPSGDSRFRPGSLSPGKRR
jgi:DNA-binding transcriptional LysR family regulator